ncbi:tripartite tricarboxylate transporter TctB family protein [Virgibacillus sp. NKC19-16]|uniref:tripartite tricarboxylate transporter TctB family protein n=1 Tax=Virgibacillus salidurans TaxID=2831673 RepID=UPI001F33ECCC|nr:tripartite tricarboxylate transporter TctB family protein [Virgibacillus sp. NKC19-16]UJL45716.1 tripartite tricarboxylate transporter TctB family protein [Virgibacillus sp. NKC19-16]
MTDFFTIELSYSNYHLIFPKIIASILIMIGIVLLVTSLIKKWKAKKLRFQFKFFSENYDKVKIYGTIILLIVYVLTLEIIGFVPASIIFMVLVTLLYIGNIKKKSITVSITNSLATTIVIWYVFGQLFDITLP